jgi:hypothetical protein
MSASVKDHARAAGFRGIVVTVAGLAASATLPELNHDLGDDDGAPGSLWINSPMSDPHRFGAVRPRWASVAVTRRTVTRMSLRGTQSVVAFH